MKKTSLPLFTDSFTPSVGSFPPTNEPSSRRLRTSARGASGGGRTLARGGRSRPRRDARRAPLPSSGRRRRLSRRGARARGFAGAVRYSRKVKPTRRAPSSGGFARGRRRSRVAAGPGLRLGSIAGTGGTFTTLSRAPSLETLDRVRVAGLARARADSAGKMDGHSGLERASARASRFGPRRSGRRATSRLPRSRPPRSPPGRGETPPATHSDAGLAPARRSCRVSRARDRREFVLHVGSAFSRRRTGRPISTPHGARAPALRARRRAPASAVGALRRPPLAPPAPGALGIPRPPVPAARPRADRPPPPPPGRPTHRQQRALSCHPARAHRLRDIANRRRPVARATMSLGTSPILAAAASDDLAAVRWLVERERIPVDLVGDWCVRDPRIGATTRPTRRADPPGMPPPLAVFPTGRGLSAAVSPSNPRAFSSRSRRSARAPLRASAPPREPSAPPSHPPRALPHPSSPLVRSSLTLPPPPSPPAPARPRLRFWFSSALFSPASATGSSPSPSLRPSVSGSRLESASRP